MSCKRAELVARAKAWLGKNEADGSHEDIVRIYNSHTPLARGYKLKDTDPWCAATVSALAIACDATDVILTEVGCTEMVSLTKEMGIFYAPGDCLPAPGDIVFYDWEKNGTSDHMGVLESREGESLTVIEGNYKNAVGRRTVKMSDSRICGYALPRYTDWVDSVGAVQVFLNVNYGAGLIVDGVYGKKTKRALLCALQKNLRVEETGVYDEKTQSSMKKNNLRKGDRGDLVAILQAFLVCSGYKEAYADGSFGSATQKALRAYQLKNGLLPDGVAGSKTLRKLCA